MAPPPANGTTLSNDEMVQPNDLLNTQPTDTTVPVTHTITANTFTTTPLPSPPHLHYYSHIHSTPTHKLFTTFGETHLPVTPQTLIDHIVKNLPNLLTPPPFRCEVVHSLPCPTNPSSDNPSSDNPSSDNQPPSSSLNSLTHSPAITQATLVTYRLPISTGHSSTLKPIYTPVLQTFLLTTTATTVRLQSVAVATAITVPGPGDILHVTTPKRDATSRDSAVELPWDALAGQYGFTPMNLLACRRSIKTAVILGGHDDDGKGGVVGELPVMVDVTWEVYASDAKSDAKSMTPLIAYRSRGAGTRLKVTVTTNTPTAASKREEEEEDGGGGGIMSKLMGYGTNLGSLRGINRGANQGTDRGKHRGKRTNAQGTKGGTQGHSAIGMLLKDAKEDMMGGWTEMGDDVVPSAKPMSVKERSAAKNGERDVKERLDIAKQKSNGTSMEEQVKIEKQKSKGGDDPNPNPGLTKAVPEKPNLFQPGMTGHDGSDSDDDDSGGKSEATRAPIESTSSVLSASTAKGGFSGGITARVLTNRIGSAIAQRIIQKPRPAPTASSGVSDAVRAEVLLHFLVPLQLLRAHYKPKMPELDQQLYAHFNDLLDEGPIPTLREKRMTEQAREMEIDEEKARRVANANVSKMKSNNNMEDAILGFSNATWMRWPNTVDSPVEYFYKPDEPGWGQAKCSVDDDPAIVAGYLWSFLSFERTNDHVQTNGNLFLRDYTLDRSLSKFLTEVTKVSTQTSFRVFSTWYVASRTNHGDIVLAFAPVTEYNEDSDIYKQISADVATNVHASNAVEATKKGFFRIHRTAPRICEVTLVLQLVLGGTLPSFSQTTYLKLSLELLAKLQDRFERNPRIVDAESRSAFSCPVLYSRLAPKKQQLINNCLALAADNTQLTPFAPIPSPSPSVTAHARSNKASSNLRPSVLVLKASLTIDAPPMSAVAWNFLFMGRERSRASKEKGHHLARIKTEEFSEHDFIHATLLAEQYPFRNREIVARQIVYKETDGEDMLIATQSFDNLVDYGIEPRSVHGFTRSLVRVSPILNDPASCKVTVVLYYDVRGHVLSFTANQRAQNYLFSSLAALRREFQRDDEIDATARERIAAEMSTPQTYSGDEERVIEDLNQTLGNLLPATFMELESPDHYVSMFLQMADSSEKTSGVMQASCVVDASTEDCFSYEVLKNSRANLREMDSKLYLERDFVKVNSHKYIYHAVSDILRGFLTPREFLCEALLKRMGPKTFVTVYSSIDSYDGVCEEAGRSRYVRGSASVVWKYEELPPIADIPQTKVTWTQKLDIGGSVPRWIVDKGVVNQLMYISRIRSHFDHIYEIDRGSRESTLQTLVGHTDQQNQYEEVELNILADGAKWIEKFDADPGKVKIDLGNPTVTAELLAHDFEEDSKAWGCSEMTVRGRKFEVLAYLWNSDARCRWTDPDVERRVLETNNPHNRVTYRRIKLSGNLGVSLKQHCELVERSIWRKEEDGSLLLVGVPSSYAVKKEGETNRRASRRASEHRTTPVRGTMKYAVRIMSVKSEEGVVLSKVFFLYRLSLGGSLMANQSSQFLRMTLLNSMAVKSYFQERCRLDEYCREDGKIIGMYLMHPPLSRSHKMKPWDNVRNVVKAHRGLKKLSKSHPWLAVFLEEITKGQLNPFLDAVPTKLECLSELEALRIGSKLSAALRQRKTAQAGIYQWMMQNPSMVELFDKHPFMQDMVLTMSREILKAAPWGVVFRVCTGAGLSLLDMISDINVIAFYSNIDGQRGYAWALLGMLGMSLFLQLGLVFMNYRSRPQRMLMEIVYVLTCVKPGVLAYRVAVNAQQEEDSYFDHQQELLITKGVEIFAESIPGCVLQCYAYIKLLQGGHSSLRAIGSILVSALTTGYSSATIAYDLDSDPDNRRVYPSFYGYIPSKAQHRTTMFLCMLLNSGIMLIIRSLTAGLLIFVSPLLSAGAYLAELGLYLSVKGVRGDFNYWLPNGEGWAGLMLAVVTRVGFKAVSDFTCIVHFRSPTEMGGLAWTLSAGNAILMLVVAASLFSSRGFVGSGGGLWSVVAGVIGLWLGSFYVYYELMVKKYRISFLSTMTGKQAAVEQWNNAEEDEGKVAILLYNEVLWAEVRDEVGDWIKAGWWRWEDESPSWWTEGLKRSIPIDMVPSDELKLDNQRRDSSMRRRSSAATLVAGLSVSGGLRKMSSRVKAVN